MPLGRTIKLFMADGDARGVVIAELSLFTGQVLIAPRASLTSLLARKEAQKAGVYILIGPDPSIAGSDTVYIGETDRISRRLSQHDADTEMAFFDRVCAIISKDEMLTKGHCLYLESSLITEVRKSKRVGTLNTKAPEPRGLPEADCADMDGFLEQLRVMLPVLGFDILKSDRTREEAVLPNGSAGRTVNADPSQTFSFTINGASAQMQKISGEYVILANSSAVIAETESIPANVRARRKAMVADGRLMEDGRLYRFTADVGFGSASAASATIAGRSDNGRLSWKDSLTGLTLGEVEERQDARSETYGLEINID
jgi:predicted GIY-YIG superfamily endonuclease